ncbi:F-box protein At3g57590 isoform X2 [Eutrema salsugineum]|uniref:F-box protein At3g57590 isoform X2 n=1 Tax=Eutrema salsugineum TaxID=72664 RepID=UPI000CED784B|nr:F-box protein At3g57590 isoform X2 [Eutrema salsugineum]
MEPFPSDVSREIFSRLPVKSVARFRSLSKLWGSTLCSPDFTELFQTRSRARPRLLFAVERYASGLVYFPDMWIPKEDSDGGGYSPQPVICNPITGKYQSLPAPVDRYRKTRDFLGFDPIDKQFKALSEAYPSFDDSDHHQILTLGRTGDVLSWTRNKHCPLYGRSLSQGICINGVIYYLAYNIGGLPRVIVCFDVRSEEFKLIEADCFSGEDTIKLISYNGKLGGVNWNYDIADGGRRILELCVWVLEDVEKPEWLKSVYTLSEDKIVDTCNFSVAGMTGTGEIVLCMDYTSKPFYVFYFHPEKNTLRCVEIRGFGADLEAIEKRGRVHVFVDHIEDLNINDAKQFKT